MTDVPPPVQRLVDATNAGDSDAFVASFTTDAYLEDWGRGFHGREGVRSWDSTDNIGVGARFEIVSSRNAGDEYVVTMRVSGGGFNGTSDFRFQVRGSEISRMIIEA